MAKHHEPQSQLAVGSGTVNFMETIAAVPTLGLKAPEFCPLLTKSSQPTLLTTTTNTQRREACTGPNVESLGKMWGWVGGRCQCVNVPD